MTATDDIVRALGRADITALAEFGPSPTEIIVLRGKRTINLTRGFNVDGWEAQWETYGNSSVDQSIPDGPAYDAPASLVVRWVKEIVAP